MIYPENFEQTLGFDRIRDWLSAFCRFQYSKELALHGSPITDAAAIEKLYNEMDEWIQFVQLNPAAADWSQVDDISNYLPSLQIENYYLEEEQLFELNVLIIAFTKLLKVLSKKQEDFPHLYSAAGNPGELEKCKTIIDSVLDDKGQLHAFASVEYGKLGAEIGRLEKDTRQAVRGIFRAWRDAGYTAETDITVREERLVIPVQSEHKRKVKGFVKDISATGRVLYIEPVESLEMNNRLKELYAERRRERERILMQTTARLRPFQSVMQEAMQGISALDYIVARVSLSKKINGNRPIVKPYPHLKLKEAFNPLLWLKNKQEKRPTIPLSVELNKEKHILIISGPNAGGKSISLKTIVLLPYMVQFGLFIPALPESECGIFTHIAIDCGDGQSIENGLSTFSAHVQHLHKMLAISGPSCLFGIDEMGDGTDPRFGAPIAQAILEQLNKNGAFAVVTSHHSRLKEWAGHTEGVLNASMAYDTNALQPLYKLQIGKPGSSFAIQILKKTGFEDHLIKRVDSLAGEESGKTEDLLLQLEEKEQQLNRTLRDAVEKQEQLDLLLEEYAKLKAKIEEKRSEIIQAAREKADKLLADANREIELTIRSIREHGANPEKTKKSREKLKSLQEKNANEMKHQKAVKTVKPATANPKAVQVVYKPGMYVRNLLNSSRGEVLEVKGNKILAAFGLIKMWVTVNEIEPMEGVEKTTRKPVSGFNWIERQSEYKTETDLRGVMADEALSRVQNWIEEGYALGHKQLKIIHGRGDGILRKVLRDFFKSQNIIKSWRSEREEHGGDGCTILELL